MEDIINAFDGIYNAYIKRYRIEHELESELSSIKDFTSTDLQLLAKLIWLKREELKYFYEHGYLFDAQYNAAISALFNMEGLINEINT